MLENFIGHMSDAHVCCAFLAVSVDMTSASLVLYLRCSVNCTINYPAKDV